MASTTDQTEEYTIRLAEFAASLHLSAVPEDFQRLLRVFILDTASAMLCGAVQPVYESAVRMIKATHRPGGQHTAIDGTETTLSGATFLNGVAAGCFEFEHVIQTTHPASAMLPALLTVASAYHKTGEELMTATVVGYELSTRIGFACTKHVEEERGFHNPGLNGHLATAAAVGRLMGFDAATIASAMGIAASSASGLMAFVNTGAMTKRLHPARGGQLGLEAAFLAKEGVLGPSNILENARGFLQAFSPSPEPETLTRGLGQEWTGKTMMLKLSPVHMTAQAFVYAINKMRDSDKTLWTADKIETVTVYGGPNALRPSHMIRLPESLVSAQYSVPFSIAAALTVDLRDPMQMSYEILSNTLTRRVSEHMKFVVNDEDARSLTGRVVMQSGSQEIIINAGEYPGLPGSPGYADAALDKYKRVVDSLNITGHGKVIRGMIESIEIMTDVSGLMDSLIKAGSEACRRFSLLES